MEIGIKYVFDVSEGTLRTDSIVFWKIQYIPWNV